MKVDPPLIPPAEARGRTTVFISAGEASGDLHGSHVVRELKTLLPEAEFFGLGGDRMQAEGVELLFHAKKLAIMGFAEVIRHLPYLTHVRRTVLREVMARRPDLILLIDYPGMHFSLLRYLNLRRDVYRPQILYYIVPQVWAWKASRGPELANLADKIAVIFPFEVEVFQKFNGHAEFVGHPLLDEVGEIPPRGEFLRRLGLEPDDRVLCLLPGSRKQELRRHLPLVVETVRILRKVAPDVKPVLAEAPTISPKFFDSYLKDSGIIRARGVSHELLCHANASLVKSGSSTVEAAFFGNPFLVFYKTSPLSYAIGKRIVKVPHIAMANLLAGEEVVPEFVQDAATPDALAGALLPLLTIPDAIRNARAKLDRVRARLGEPGAAKRVAQMAKELLIACGACWFL
ncbi:lipid-A-disaccharide synthase [bacterium]|nr:lipid-A-disaccharide synthase [bacterium]